jgi:hypothetical protein
VPWRGKRKFKDKMLKKRKLLKIHGGKKRRLSDHSTGSANDKTEKKEKNIHIES